jgi:hypothetical protein
VVKNFWPSLAVVNILVTLLSQEPDVGLFVSVKRIKNIINKVNKNQNFSKKGMFVSR